MNGRDPTIKIIGVLGDVGIAGPSAVYNSKDAKVPIPKIPKINALASESNSRSYRSLGSFLGTFSCPSQNLISNRALTPNKLINSVCESFD